MGAFLSAGGCHGSLVPGSHLHPSKQIHGKAAKLLSSVFPAISSAICIPPPMEFFLSALPEISHPGLPKTTSSANSLP